MEKIKEILKEKNIPPKEEVVNLIKKLYKRYEKPISISYLVKTSKKDFPVLMDCINILSFSNIISIERGSVHLNYKIYQEILESKST